MIFRRCGHDFAVRLRYILEALEPRTLLAGGDFPNLFHESTPVVAGKPVAARVDYRTDEDTFRLGLKGNQTYRVDIRHPRDWRITAWFNAPPGEDLDQLLTLRIFEELHRDTLTAFIRPNADGEYFLQVGDDEITDAAKHFIPIPYTVTLKAVAQEDDHPNTIAQAEPIEADDVVHGSFSDFGDHDVFAIHMDAGWTYALDGYYGGYPSPQLFGPDGGPLEQNDGTFQPLVGGTYYLDFATQNDWVGRNYHFTIDSEQIDHSLTPQAAPDFAPGQTMEINFQFPGDIHYFHFHTEAGHPYLVSLLDEFGSATLELTPADDPMSNMGQPLGYVPGDWTHQIESSYLYTADTTEDRFLAVFEPWGFGTQATLTILDLAGQGPASIGAVSASAPAGATLGQAAAFNLFRFHATADSRYRFDTTLDEPVFDVISDPADAPGRLWSDLNQSEFPSSFSWTAPADGDYYLAVAAHDPTQTSAYTISETEVQDDYPNALGRAFALELPAAISGSLLEDDQDAFAFDVMAGQNYIFNFLSDADRPDVRMILINPDGTDAGLALSYYGEHSEARSTLRMVWNAPSSEQYGIIITAFKPVEQYRFSVVQEASPQSAATPLDLGSPSQPRFDSPGDTLWYQFFTNPHDRYRFESTPGAVDPTFAIVDVDGETVLASDGERYDRPHLISFVPERSGPYFLRISSWDGMQTGDFTLTPTVIPDAPDVPSPEDPIISPGSPASDDLGFSDDVDVFAFHGAVNHADIFDLGSSSSGAVVYDTSVYFNILGTDGQTVLATLQWMPEVEWCGSEVWIGDQFDHYIDAYCDWGHFTSELAFYPPSEGDYYLQVERKNTNGSGYLITEEDVPDDHGHDLETATPVMPSAAPVSGLIEYFGDADYFSFQADAGQAYSLYIQMPNSRGWDIEALSQAGASVPLKRMVSNEPDWPNLAVRSDLVATEAGTYFIRIGGSVGSRYSVKLDAAPASSAATTLEGGDLVTDQLAPGEIRRFEVNVPAGAVYRFYVSSADGSALAASLSDSPDDAWDGHYFADGQGASADPIGLEWSDVLVRGGHA